MPFRLTPTMISNDKLTERERGIFDVVLSGRLELEKQLWTSISADPKDLVKLILQWDPSKHLTAAQVLGLLSYYHNCHAFYFY